MVNSCSRLWKTNIPCWVGGWPRTDNKANLSPAELDCCWNWAELGYNSTLNLSVDKGIPDGQSLGGPKDSFHRRLLSFLLKYQVYIFVLSCVIFLVPPHLSMPFLLGYCYSSQGGPWPPLPPPLGTPMSVEEFQMTVGKV